MLLEKCVTSKSQNKYFIHDMIEGKIFNRLQDDSDAKETIDNLTLWKILSKSNIYY